MSHDIDPVRLVLWNRSVVNVRTHDAGALSETLRLVGRHGAASANVDRDGVYALHHDVMSCKLQAALAAKSKSIVSREITGQEP